jgi:hypothetical protein
LVSYVKGRLKGVVEYIGVKQDRVTGDWRKPHNEEHHVVYCSPNVEV